MKRLARRSKKQRFETSVRDIRVRDSFSGLKCSLTTRVDEFNQYMSYVRNLEFEAEPDYNYLRDLFTRALKNTGETEDGVYDWMKLNDGRGWEVPKPTGAHLKQ
jgi:hypothetical protein